MITKNEENDLPRCLERIRPYVEEIIVVDTGSTDATREVAAAFDANVFNFRWIDDFSAARNQSLASASGDWILVLDADELIAQKDLNRIRTLIMRDDVDAYGMQQRNYSYDISGAGWRPPDEYDECMSLGYESNPIVRLFRNNKGIEYSNKVHETLVESLTRLNCNVVDSGIPIHHYGFVKPEASRDKKRDLYLRIGLKQIEEKPDHPRAHYETALIYKNTGRIYEALNHFEKVASIDPTYEAVHFNLGEVFTKTGEFQKAIESYRESIRRNPDHEASYVNLSAIYFDLSRTDEAIELLEMAIERNPLCAMAYNNLAFILIRKNQITRAAKVLKEAHRRTGVKKFRDVSQTLMESEASRKG